MNEETIELLIENEWLWETFYQEDYEPSPYDGTYTEE